MKVPNADDELKVRDLLIGSYLNDSKTDLSDLIHYDGLRNWRLRVGVQRIPFGTLDCFYEQFALGKL